MQWVGTLAGGQGSGSLAFSPRPPGRLCRQGAASGEEGRLLGDTKQQVRSVAFPGSEASPLCMRRRLPVRPGRRSREPRLTLSSGLARPRGVGFLVSGAAVRHPCTQHPWDPDRLLRSDGKSLCPEAVTPRPRWVGAEGRVGWLAPSRSLHSGCRSLSSCIISRDVSCFLPNQEKEIPILTRLGVKAPRRRENLHWALKDKSGLPGPICLLNTPQEP